MNLEVAAPEAPLDVPPTGDERISSMVLGVCSRVGLEGVIVPGSTRLPIDLVAISSTGIVTGIVDLGVAILVNVFAHRSVSDR